jgi:IclR family KDG regulon transcriptional repressor
MDVMVRSVLLITGVLEALANEKQLGVSELAARLGIHKSTVYRFLCSLKALGYVRQIDDNEKYGLSYKLLDLAGRILSSIDVRQAARTVMERLCSETCETVHLATLEQTDVIYIDKIDSSQPLRMHSYIGQKIPIHTSALGKVLLAWGPQNILKGILEKGNLKRLTDTSITEPAALTEEIGRIRAQGYAEDREESVPGVRCVAAPILNREGSAVAALSISLPSQRFNDEKLESLQKMVREGALQISERMGFKGHDDND